MIRNKFSEVKSIDTWEDLKKELFYYKLCDAELSQLTWLFTSPSPEFRDTIPENISKLWLGDNMMVLFDHYSVKIGHHGTRGSIYNSMREFKGTGAMYGITVRYHKETDYNS